MNTECVRNQRQGEHPNRPLVHFEVDDTEAGRNEVSQD